MRLEWLSKPIKSRFMTTNQNVAQVYKFPDSSKEIAEICFALSLRSFKSEERYFTISSPLVICCSNFVLIALKGYDNRD